MESIYAFGALKRLWNLFKKLQETLKIILKPKRGPSSLGAPRLSRRCHPLSPSLGERKNRNSAQWVAVSKCQNGFEKKEMFTPPGPSWSMISDTVFFRISPRGAFQIEKRHWHFYPRISPPFCFCKNLARTKASFCWKIERDGCGIEAAGLYCCNYFIQSLKKIIKWQKRPFFSKVSRGS